MNANTRFGKNALMVATVLASLGTSGAMAGSNDCSEIPSYLCNEPFYATQPGTARGAEGPIRADSLAGNGQADAASSCAEIPVYMCNQPFFTSTPSPDARGALGPVRTSEADVTAPLAIRDTGNGCSEIPVYMCHEPFFSLVR